MRNDNLSSPDDDNSVADADDDAAAATTQLATQARARCLTPHDGARP